MIRQHDVVDGRCVYCGALKPDSEGNTCVDRPDVARPEPARREYASEAFDVIGARLAELRKERDAVLNQPPTMEDLLS